MDNKSNDKSNDIFNESVELEQYELINLPELSRLRSNSISIYPPPPQLLRSTHIQLLYPDLIYEELYKINQFNQINNENFLDLDLDLFQKIQQIINLENTETETNTELEIKLVNTETETNTELEIKLVNTETETNTELEIKLENTNTEINTESNYNIFIKLPLWKHIVSFLIPISLGIIIYLKK
jgi:hypothetical protein